MQPTEYAQLAGSSLFVIVDPTATVPAFLAMTARDTVPPRGLLLACLAVVGLASYITLALDAKGATWLTAMAEKIVTHLRGLLLAALAIQSSFKGLREKAGCYSNNFV